MADNPARRISQRRSAANGSSKASGRNKLPRKSSVKAPAPSGRAKRNSGTDIKALRRSGKRRAAGPSASGKISAVRKVKRVSEQAVVGEPEGPTNLELEVVQPSFKRGLPIAVKIALVTAGLLAVACTILGFVVSDITTKAVEAQINQSGIAMCNVFERSVDRFWEVPKQYAHDPESWEGSDEYQEQKASVQDRLSKLINDEGSAAQIYNVMILTRNGQQFLVSAMDADQVKERDPRPIESPVEKVKITQVEVNVDGKNVQVRKFEKELGRMILPEPDRNQDPDFGDEGDGEEAPVAPLPEPRFEPTAKLNILLSAERIGEVGRNLRLRTMIAAVVVILMGVALTIVLASYFTAPIRYLVQDVESVSAGDLAHKTLARSRDEIGLLAETFDIMTRNLKLAQEAEAKKKSIEHELNIAKEIQTKLLPERIPKIPGYSMHAYYKSAREVGGDYYDFIIIDEHHLGIIVADVSGKGIPASMVMTMTRSLIRLASHRNVSAQDTLRKVNRILAKDIRRGMFVTAAYMVLDIRTRNLKICSAGHNPLLLYRASTRSLESIKPKGMALGFDKGPAFDKSLEEKDVTLKPGDCLVAYTDGVVEAMDEAKEEYGEKHFEEVVKEHASKPVEQFVDEIVSSLEQHRGHAEQSDDITITTLSVS